jgi:polar amino acid transport system substrate-binding protein
MKLNKMVTGTLFAAVTLLAITGCGEQKSKDSLENIKDKGTLVVATSADYPPYEFLISENSKNKIVGMDIDLAEAIAKKLGVKLEIKNMQFDSVLASVSAGKTDIAISGFNITEEHKKSFDFSISYYHSGQVALINKKDADKYTKLSDFSRKKIMTQQGSVCNDVAKKQLPDSQMITTDAVPNGVMQLQSGKVEAMILDIAVAKGYADNNPDLAISIAKFKEDGSEENGIVLPKNSGKLKKEIDAIVKEQVSSGKVKEYLKKNGKLQAQIAKDAMKGNQ